MATETRRVEYLPLASIKGAPRNPKEHAEKDLAASVGRFGFVETPVLDERTQRLVAGHGRMKVLVALKAAGAPAPRGVEVRGDDWYIPVERGWASADDHEAEAYLVASNRITEQGGWNDADLGALLKDLRSSSDGALDGIGFSSKEVDKLLNGLARTAAAGDQNPDQVLAPPASSKVQPGQVWLLGDHRMICGDSTDPDVWDRLMLGKRAALLATDPPYGVEYNAEWRAAAGLAPGGKVRTGKVANDDQADWERVYRLAPADVAYVWHASAFSDVVMRGLREAGFDVRQQIIWNKNHAAISRSHYHWGHEPCWYAVRKGATANWLGDRKQTTVWDAGSPIGSGGAGEAKTAHPTQKPAVLWEIPIYNHTPEGGLLVDPFLGSGTAIIAAEKTHRACYGIELDVAYCQLIIDRWEKYSGKVATLEVDPVDIRPKTRRPAKASASQVEVAEAIFDPGPTADSVIGCKVCACPCALVGEPIPADGLCVECRTDADFDQEV